MERPLLAGNQFRGELRNETGYGSQLSLELKGLFSIQPTSGLV